MSAGEAGKGVPARERAMSDIENDPAIAAARATVIAETAKTEEAVLRPRDPGGIAEAERMALAVRMALLGDNAQLADRYLETLAALDPPRELLDVARGLGSGAGRLRVLTEHVDRITSRPDSAGPADIEALRAGGVSDADIVRLSQLIAFVNHRLRTDHALALLGRVA